MDGKPVAGSTSTPKSSAESKKESSTDRRDLDRNGDLDVYSMQNGSLRVHKYLTAEELAAGKTTSWAEIELRGTIRNISQPVFEMDHLTALFINDNELERLPPEISKLSKLKVLDASNNRIRSLPSELGDILTLEQLHLNNNLIRTLPFEIGKLYNLKILALHGNPLSPELNQVYHHPTTSVKVLQYFLVQLCARALPPPERPWIRTDVGDKDHKFIFTVMCYNVLCEKYATPSQYPYCPSWALNWDYRRRMILSEIRSYEPDVIAFQEVETEQFYSFFVPELKRFGYAGIFSPKSRAKTMTEDERKFVDGCAIFWKSSKYIIAIPLAFSFYVKLLFRFELEKKHLIEFTQLAIANANGCQQMLNRVMTRDNIALAAVLQPTTCVLRNNSSHWHTKNNCIPLIVCTAHIHWDPEFCDVKLVQTMMLVQELGYLVDSVAQQRHLTTDQIPLLVCGDLNSVPASGVHEFLATGKIACDHPDFKDFRGTTCLQKLSSTKDTNNYAHQMKLETAYDSSMISFTNFTLDFKGIIDYVFSTPSSLLRLGVLGAVDITWLLDSKYMGCPNPSIPSDHIPLLVQYAIIPQNIPDNEATDSKRSTCYALPERLYSR
ncbi:CCR4-NOT transcription complex subunit 6 [Trichinella sp. T8]|uniref:poly(A)-specific ribonuclease n=1 Tax=Trichinella murrelli TaxID=144512 RepID=A0A0V0U5E9_9BILA|nr:CCR4-NOT transcription complex subunit 6 [Trichinella murrelli]KRZ94498.1 CCR4-NOT transcription complex subunit 6 [Trichinella sp. T8]